MVVPLDEFSEVGTDVSGLMYCPGASCGGVVLHVSVARLDEVSNSVHRPLKYLLDCCPGCVFL